MFHREFIRYPITKNASNEGQKPGFAVHYTSTGCIQSIKIVKRDGVDIQSRHVLSIECAPTQEGRSVTEGIERATAAVKIWPGEARERPALQKNGECTFSTEYTDEKHLKQLIIILHGIEQNHTPILDEATHNHLLEDIDVLVYSKDIYDCLVTAAESNRNEVKELALQLHNEYGYIQILWYLAKYFTQKQWFNDAVELLTKIPAENPYYTQVCLELRTLYQRQLTIPSSLPTEQIPVIENKLLELSLLAKDHDYATHMFYDIAGLEEESLTIPRVKLHTSPEMYIFLARQIAAVSKENEYLQQELRQLKQQHPANTIDPKDNSGSQSASVATTRSFYAPSSPALFTQNSIIKEPNQSNTIKLKLE